LPGCAAAARFRAGPVLFYVFDMKLAGFLLLLAGWGLVLSAVVLLASPSPRAAFVLGGMGVELLGLALAVRAHLLPRAARDRERS